MEIIILWIVFSFLAGYIAEQKGRSPVGFFVLSLALSPLVGIIAAFASASKRADPNAPTLRTHMKCPECREMILKDARKCKHCGTTIVAAGVPTIPAGMRACPDCKRHAPIADPYCPSCGHNMG